MNIRKFLNYGLLLLVFVSLIVGSSTQPRPVGAMPTDPQDESKVPHYFGPYPNWANSPFTLPDVAVTISGDGTGAMATASVNGLGAITGITITDPGSGYTAATVAITGGGTLATADAVVSTSGSVTAITVDTPGAGYTAPLVSIGGGGVPLVDASVTAAAATRYDVSAGSATGGSFTLTVDGLITGAIAWNALNTDIESALLAIGAPATVTGAGPWVITFAVAPTTASMDNLGLTILVPVPDFAYAAVLDTYNVTAGSATGGTFTLSVNGGAPTAAINWNALNTDIESALLAIGAPATVSGTGPWVVVFAVAPSSVSIDGALLSQAVLDFSASVGATTDVYNVTAGSATGGTFLLDVDGLIAGPIAWNAPAGDVEASLVAALIPATVTGTGPWVITFTTAPTLVTMDGASLTQGVADASASAAAATKYTVHVGSASGGTFTLSVNSVATASINWNAAAADVESALGLGVATVSGTGALGDPWVIVFALAPASFAMDGTLLTMTGLVPDTSMVVVVDTYVATAGSANGGTFALTVDGLTTLPIAWNAAASVVQNELLAAGVTASVSGTGPWAITFAVAPTLVTLDGALLTQPVLTGATATAYGGVTLVNLTFAGSGYKFPTVDFDMPNDPDGTQASGHVVCVEVDCIPAVPGDPVTIAGVAVDVPGSGYSTAPNVVIRDGTIFDPVPGGGSGATALAYLSISSITMDTFGSGYSSAPTVVISDPNGDGATATALVDVGAVTAINLTNPGSGYLTTGGIKKFQDGLPKLCIPTANFSECASTAANNLGQYIPIAIPDQTTFTVANGFTADADYYVIAVVQHRERMSSSLPAQGTLLREYVQLETPANASFSRSIPLFNQLLDGSSVPALMPDGVTQAVAVDDPHFLGPVIVANKNKPVRIVFYNLLPTGSDGDLFLPTDSSIMGSGMGPMDMPEPLDEGTVMDMVRNPMCGEYPKSDACFKDNRATLHLHGGTSPWISDGTAHQWITPADEMTMWPKGVDVAQVPDMLAVPGVPDCSVDNSGCLSFYYTNQQSARLLFYHDHSWGITRLNVYAGEAAGYVITDATEQSLFGPTGPYASMGEGIPLVIQDRTFVPDTAQLAAADPTWDSARWGGYGNFWYHHVYMPAQNPGDPGGMSGYGRWMYGPWFWPPATPPHGPIANPYYDPTCNIDDPLTWQYDTDPFCEPELIPGTPNISVGMEQFNDTPLVNGTAYPTTGVLPQSYRFRILNAANDRFWNLQWYIADPRTGTLSEVALNPAEVAAAQLDPVVFPTPDMNWSPAGPDWIVIGSEGGFLPAPVLVDGQQPTTWITDPTRFDVGNVDLHSLLLAPAERADVIVDFSQFRGKTLILYNDAPAAFPARVPSYDYYTGAPDLSPNGAANILPGYGPNTRTIMQVVVADVPPAPAFNLTALRNAFKHHADGSGVFESGQHPIIVGQAAYNSAYGTTFAASSWCNAPGSPITRCDGLARISDQGGTMFGFNTLKFPRAKTSVYIQPKAIHDEMNAVAFDEFGRMTANLGLEVVPATPALQNVVLYPFVNPATELIDATNLPKLDQAGLGMTPISTGNDGTQIWKITHNGVDTHPIHFHLYDVQVLNRVTWGNIIIPTDPTELGWKDTVRISPLQDTIVALRPIIPYVPFELPNSIRMLNPMMPEGSTTMFNNTDAQGNPTAPIVNQLVNFGWQYVYHCHILSHEEMDMMRPVSVAIPPIAPDGLAYTVTGVGNNTGPHLTWNDNSINETEFLVQRSSNGGAWTDLGSVLSPLDQPNIHESRSYDDATFRWNSTAFAYRVVAKNTIGYGGAYATMSVQSISASVAAIQAPRDRVTSLLVPPAVNLSWFDNAANETGFNIERSDNGGPFVQIATRPARNGTGNTTYVDATVTLGNTYTYRVATVNAVGSSAYSNPSTILVDVPAAPSNVNAVAVSFGANERVTLTWTNNASNVTRFMIERSTDPGFTTVVTAFVSGNLTTYTTGNIPKVAYYFRVSATNVLGASAPVNATPFPVPPAP